MNRANFFSLRSLLAGVARYRLAVTLGLALLALAGYMLYVFQQVEARGVFEYVGIDFRLLYASGQIVRAHGMSAVYRPEYQAEFQGPLYERFSHFVPNLSLPFWALPIPYLPVFVAPIVPLSFLPPLTAFLVWVGLNTVIMLGYLYLWVKRLAFERVALVTAGAIFLSIASFLNLIFGQVNLILLIAVGEALFNLAQGHHGRAGLWLALGWIKPQMILLLVLAAALRRNGRFVGGFLGGSLLIGGTSLALAGWEGIIGVMRVLQTWPVISRSSGMTWLSAVDHLVARGMTPWVALGLGGLIVGVILLAWLDLLRVMPFWGDLETGAEVFLATLAVETIVMPHGNVHMALALGIPWLVVVCQRPDGVTWGAFLTWSLVNGLIFIGDAQRSVAHAHDLLGICL
ncbi:MAG: DUF2029 domain-containing protein, partial [Thermanaerothrix sp.]|nr:DUF2029 domain-containing protein [Thermanaerothrix sp.]